MEITILGFIIIFVILHFTATKIADNKKYHRGYNNGWDDCIKAHDNFELSPDDELVLYIMKKALRAYLRDKKYVDKEALEEVESVDNFRDFKHVVHYLAVYKKENIERE